MVPLEHIFPERKPMLSLNHLVILALVVVVGYLAAKWLFQKDTEIENRRRGAAKLAAALKSYGLVKTPEFLIDYSVGDYSGMAEKIKALTDLFLAGEEQVIKEFDQVYTRVLEAKLRTEEGRALLAAKLADAAKVTDPSQVKATVAGVASAAVAAVKS